jgi:uncharacterized protein YigA (DUF484 family)
MSAKAKSGSISEEAVREFLIAHPEFLRDNPDILNAILPPERELGGGVIDFQHFMVKNLQKDSKDLQGKYDMLVDFCRENMSVQSQVHHAVLRLIGTRNLEQLLEVVALDLVNLFDVDVVRLAMESDIIYETAYGEENFSGIVFVDPGTVDAAIGVKKKVLLIDDTEVKQPAGFAQIFADCDEMIASCALLRLELAALDKNIVLAFGVRHKDRFHPGQGIELVNFLAQIVAFQLDRYLDDLSV